MTERSWFDAVPDLYDRIRPRYPPALFDDLLVYVAESGLSGLPRTVEIGPGTGQATGALLERGIEVTAVEPGVRLAWFLRRKFADQPRLQVVNEAFESVELSERTYDLVLAATSFHWVAREVRLTRSHALLGPGGVLAIVGTNQVRSAVDRGYFERSFPIYRRYRPDEVRMELPGADVVPPEYEEVATSELFGAERLLRYRWDQRYSTADYGDLLRTYSDTQRMDPGAQEALIAELSALIDAEFDGYVVRPLVITLVLAKAA